MPRKKYLASIDKHRSGNYRIRKTINGKQFKATLDHKPSQSEVAEIIAQFYNSPVTGMKDDDSFEKGFEVYVAERPASISASTINGYESIMRNIPDYFKKMKISKIESKELQHLVNVYAKGRSEKTVKNMYGLVTAVVRYYRPTIALNVSLPVGENLTIEDETARDYIPTDEDIKRIMRLAKGTNYEIPLYLAIFGLRRSEICALEIDDVIEDDIGHSVRIWKAKVKSNTKEFIIQKNTKTSRKAKKDRKTRTVHIPDQLYELIMKQDYSIDKRLYRGAPDVLRNKLVSYQEKLGIQHFTLHKLRHYFATKAHELGFSDEEIMAMGGWDTPVVLDNTYRHAQPKNVKKSGIIYAKNVENIME